MVKLEYNMTNLKDTKTRVTLGDSIPITSKKRGDWYGYDKEDEKLHRVDLYNMAVITGLHVNICRMTQAQQKSFQVTSEGETPTLKKNPIMIRFDKKMENNSGKGFLRTTKFYKIANNTAPLSSKIQKLKGKETLQPEGTAENDQEKMTTKHLQRGKFTQTSSRQNSDILNKTGQVRLQSTYTTTLRRR